MADVPPYGRPPCLGNLPTQIYGHGQLTTLFLYGPILSKDHVPVCNLARDLAIGATEELYERNLLDIPSMKVGHYKFYSEQ